MQSLLLKIQYKFSNLNKCYKKVIIEKILNLIDALKTTGRLKDEIKPAGFHFEDWEKFRIENYTPSHV